MRQEHTKRPEWSFWLRWLPWRIFMQDIWNIPNDLSKIKLHWIPCLPFFLARCILLTGLSLIQACTSTLIWALRFDSPYWQLQWGDTGGTVFRKQLSPHIGLRGYFLGRKIFFMMPRLDFNNVMNQPRVEKADLFDQKAWLIYKKKTMPCHAMLWIGNHDIACQFIWYDSCLILHLINTSFTPRSFSQNITYLALTVWVRQVCKKY